MDRYPYTAGKRWHFVNAKDSEMTEGYYVLVSHNDLSLIVLNIDLFEVLDIEH